MIYNLTHSTARQNFLESVSKLQIKVCQTENIYQPQISIGIVIHSKDSQLPVGDWLFLFHPLCGVCGLSRSVFLILCWTVMVFLKKRPWRRYPYSAKRIAGPKYGAGGFGRRPAAEENRRCRKKVCCENKSTLPARVGIKTGSRHEMRRKSLPLHHVSG